MKIRARKGYKRPEYPEKEAFIRHPELLLGHVPGRWLKKGAAAGALLAFVSGGEIFSDDQQVTSIRSVAVDSIRDGRRFSKEKQDAKREEVKIAPLFIHGGGTGATGCVIISPPVFLSEFEALAIIESELRRSGLEFTREEHLVPGMDFQEMEEHYDGVQAIIASRKTVRPRKEKHPFYFDLYNNRYGLGIKYLSLQNFFKLGGRHSALSIQDYDMIAVAQQVREKLRQTSRESGAVFYEPIEGCYLPDGQKNLDWSRELLTKQVTDFISWFEDHVARRDKK